MKITLLLLLIFTLNISQHTCMGQGNPLDQRISIDAYQGNLGTFLIQLKEKHKIGLSYSNDNLPLGKHISIEKGEKSLREILNTIFKGSFIKYTVIGNQIIFTKEKPKTSGATFTLSGYVTDSKSGEALIGVSVYEGKSEKGTLTNNYGFYSITLFSDTVYLLIQYMGYQTTEVTVSLVKDENLNLPLLSEGIEMEEVVVEASSMHSRIHTTEMSTLHLNPRQISKIPAIMGEADIIKVMQLMPGVARGNEGGTGLFVRGGTIDQNLIIMDEATVYNIGHLFNFFSIFNNDAIKDITIYKGGFPSNYGGRLSSVVDIRMKEGNMTTYKAEGGIGLLSSRLTVEGPIIKDKVSFIVSGRRTYIDKVLPLFKMDIPYYFYDLNAKLNFKISDKDRIYVSSYLGNDILKQTVLDSSINAGFNFALGNTTTTLRWNHAFNNKLFSNVSLINTRFRYKIGGSINESSLFVSSKIADFGGKADFDYYKNPESTQKFGFSIIHHGYNPNIIQASRTFDRYIDNLAPGPRITSLEYGAYWHNDYKVNQKVGINYGLRVSGASVSEKFYTGIEPRLAVKYSLTEKDAIKLSYSRMKQYMHLVSSSSISLPTDLWYPVTKKVKPLNADQFALGYVRNFDKAKTTFTLEGYYKLMNNIIEYREGAVLVLNNKFEEELVSGKGKSYGVEALLQKNAGKINGWVSYTLSWATRDFEDINKGKTYYAKFDRRHNLSTVMSYEITKRFTVSAIWLYMTGSRFTPIIGSYLVPDPTFTGINIKPIFSERNAVKLSPTHRLDIDFTIKHNIHKRFQGEWHLGCYNVYNRTSPYRADLVTAGSNNLKYQQQGIFGRLFFISYNFKV